MGSQRTVRESWRRHIVGLLDLALVQNDAAIGGVATAISTTILAGRHVYAFGAGHSLALVSDMHRRAGGMKVVRPLWNAELTSGAVSAAPGLPKLPEIADYLLDNAGCYGDAALDVPGIAERMAPTSTVVGAALIHAVWAEVGERLVARGHVPEVWGSANRGPV